MNQIEDNMNLENIDENNQKCDSVDDNESVEKVPFDEQILKDKIDYFTKKIEEQNILQKKFSQEENENLDNQASNLVSQEEHDKSNQAVELYQLSNRLELLHQDIKICEHYKKSLENEIKDYKSTIAKIQEFENKLNSLRIEVIDLESKRDQLKLNNIALSEENEKLQKLNEEIKKSINIILSSFKEREEFIEITKKDLELMKREISDLSKMKSNLLYEISNLKREVEDRTKKVESLKNEQDTIFDKITEELQKMKTELESKII